MDKRICDLVKYIQEQKYAENTTIIIVGDHISMSNQLRNELDKYNGEGGPCGRRRAYNCFINPARKRENSSERKYSAFDLMPTILHAMGAEWGSDRMNLGVSLFGNTPTLLEKYGIEQYQKQSLMYSPKYVELIKMH